MSLATLGLALLAGVLTILSPCVLPLVPIVLGTAASEHRLGPLALAAGVALSFVAVGLFVATIGFAIGLDGGVFRAVGALAMIAIGAALAVPALQARLAAAAGPLGAWADRRIEALAGAPGGVAVPGGGGGARAPLGQLVIGLLLGTVWSPCVGPTLGAASLLAAKGESLGEVALTMTVFGLGAAAPLALIGLASRQALARWRGRLLHGGRALKQAMGVLLVALGLAILTGLDKRLEAFLVAVSPDWLTDLTTRF